MKPKPKWLVIPRIPSEERGVVEGILKNLNLNTVCREAACPNYSECFSRKTATFMILGTICTRNCHFCNVTPGRPLPVEPNEPRNVALAVQQLSLKYVVITSVTRDDLPDGGANHFAKTIKEIRLASPQTAIEVLIPDFKGDLTALKILGEAAPDVISHNMETVAALYGEVRPQADYLRSLAIIKNIKLFNAAVRSKTGIMLGLGETKEQVSELFVHLREAGCEFLTIGQYLAPTKEHLPVKAYIEPEVFDEYAALAKKLGFAFVASAPLVRSSYHAGEALGL